MRILTDPHGPGYANILATGGTFTWESWTPSDLEQDSLSHGWGSGALAGIHEALLGVSLLTSATATGPAWAPQGAVAAVAPPAGALRAAAGTLPTVAGPLGVQWTRRPPVLTLALKIPPNAAAHVDLPAASLSAVTESGHPVAQQPGIAVLGFADHVARLVVGSGSYRFTARS